MDTKWILVASGSIISAIAATLVYAMVNFTTVEANTLADENQNLVTGAQYEAIDLYHKDLEATRASENLGRNYERYYALLDKYLIAKAGGKIEYAAELARQMERIKANICAADPQWERC